MTDLRLAAAVSLAFIFSGQSLVAQASFQHREYSVVCSTATAKAVNPRSVIHAVTWDVPHTESGAALVDLVHEVLFTFYNGGLYQMIVTYDRGRTAGLTNDDLVETFSATYGVPLVRNART